FFFSSRRRHTRFSRDWSSDVCSSDLVLLDEGGRVSGLVDPSVLSQVPPHARPTTPLSAVASVLPAESVVTELLGADGVGAAAREIGRASCRERGKIWGVAAAVTKKRR